MTAVESKVVSTLKALTGRAGNVEPAMRLREDLQVTSLVLVALVSGVCEELGISLLDFTEIDLMRLSTVGDLVHLFETRNKT